MGARPDAGRIPAVALLLAASVLLSRVLGYVREAVLAYHLGTSAQADAYRKLAETVKGLQINSETYVRDFVAESDVIQTELDTFIRGVRLGKAKCYEDLSCEVPAEVTVAKVVTTLKEIHSRHYKGDSIKGTDIEQMNKKVTKKVIKVVGMGAPREDLPADLPEGVGTRHRAAVGITEETDAVVIVISEETAAISVVVGGELVRGLDAPRLRGLLRDLFVRGQDDLDDELAEEASADEERPAATPADLKSTG